MTAAPVAEEMVSGPPPAAAPPPRRTPRRAGWGVALRIGRREVRRAKGRSALVLFLIMLPVLMVTLASTMLRTADVSPAEGVPRVMGAADAVVTPPWPVTEDDAGGIVQCPDATCSAIAPGTAPATVRDQATAEAQLRSVLGPQTRLWPMPSAAVGTNVGDRALQIQVTLADLADPVFAPMVRLVAGRLPAGRGEVVVTEALAGAGATVGTSLTLGEFGPSTVVGVVRAPRAEHEAFAAPGTLPIPLMEPGVWPGAGRWLVSAPGGVSWAQVRALNAQRMVVASRAVITNPPSRGELAADPALAQVRDALGDGRSNTLPAVLALGVVMVALEVILLAGPAFAVGAAQQTRALGLVAAQGGTRRHLRRVVLGQAVVLGGLAAMLGVALGLAGAWLWATLLPRLLPSASGLGPFDVGPLDVALVAALGFASAVIAALAPARAAARLDPVRAIAGRRPQPRGSRLHPILGLALIGVGLGLAVLGAYQSRPRAAWADSFGGDGSGGNASLFIAAGAVAAVLGVILVAPLAVRLLARLGRRAPLAGRYALRDMARNQLRTAPAVAAVAGVVAGMVTLGIGAASSSAQERSMFMPTGPIGDAVVLLGTAESGAPADRERLWDATRAAVQGRFPDARTTVIRSMPDPNVGATSGRTLMLTEATVLPADANGAYVPGSVGAAQQAASAMGGGRFGGILVGPAALAGISDLLADEQRQRAGEALAAGTAVVLRNEAAARDTGTATFDVTLVDPSAENLAGPPRLGAFTVPAIGITVPGVGLPAAAVIPDALATRARVTPLTAALLVDGDDPLTTADQQRLQFVLDREPALVAAGVTGTASVAAGWADGLRTVMLVLFGTAAVLVLAGSLTSALLALSDARADFATLGAVGGAPAIRRRIAGAYGAAIAFTGAVLGAGVGFIPGVAISYPLTTDAWTPALDGRLAVTGEPIADHYLVIPWAIIATLVIGLPILVGLVVAATTRARLPMANRLN
jgi:putative ABC transport system permease protein